jgi:DNA modification methylase
VILVGDCREMLATLPERSVQTCITSPPYFGLRDYGTGEWEGGDPACDHTRQSVASRASGLGVKDGRGPYGDQFAATQGGTIAYASVCGRCGARRVDRQIGLEPTPDEFVAALVGVFREVRRVLRDDGTVWLNLGDSYASGDRGVRQERTGGQPRHLAPGT